MSEISNSYSKQAKQYDDFIRKLVPIYDDVNNILPELITAPKKVLDIGSGTGNTAQVIQKKFPDADIICVDPTEGMLEIAKTKVTGRFICSDVENLEIDDTCCAVTSIMVMHNVQSVEKRQEAYNKIYSCLKSGGVYISADILKGETEQTHKTYMKLWRDFMLKSLSEDDVDGKWIPLHQEKDKPVKLSEQTSMLQKAGFKTVEIVLKNINFALTAAYKD